MTHTENNELTTGPGAPFQPGELVDVTIRGARVVSTYLTLTVVDLNFDGGRLEIAHSSAVTIARVAPAEWPPQPGDVWSDCDGATWVALGDLNGAIEMHLSKDVTSRWSDPYEVLSVVSPMRLEYRPGWTSRPRAATAEERASEPERGSADERAQQVAGLRALAAFLERNPDLPRVYGLRGQCNPDNPMHLRQLADRHGGRVTRDDDQVVSADVNFGPVQFTFYCRKPEVEPQPAAAPPVLSAVEDDDRCQAAQPGEFAPGEHKCELYGTHPESDHVCLCGLRWPNAAAFRVDAVPPAGMVPYIGGGWINEATGQIIPAQRPAGE